MSRRCAAEISQAALESFDEVRVDGWLPFGIAARWLSPGFLRLVNAECRIQQAVRIGRAGVLGDEQEYAPVRCIEDSQQAPCAVQVKSADSRHGFSGKPHARGRASAAAYVLDR
jgi:succinylglutamate desuccinylase